ncbi:MAG: metallophosphoesterase [Anaerotignum sp.]|nr:metallophosphoesterase [Anaerotignum sp.]
MRYIVISDIHGNWAALEAARERLPGLQPDGVLFLGDYITDGADPQRILRVLREIQREYPCYFILGNREEYFLKNRNNPVSAWQPCSQTGSLWFTEQNLTEEDLCWFAQLPVSQVIRTEGAPDFMICHGSPVSANDRMLGSKNRDHREELVSGIAQNLLLCGHSHRQELYQIGEKRVLFCPSLGLPLRRNGIIPSQHMVQLDLVNGEWQHTFLTVSYDVERYIQDLLNSPFAEIAPFWCRGIAAALRTQQNLVIDCLALAKTLAENDGFSGQGCIPEKYWAQAAEQLGI